LSIPGKEGDILTQLNRMMMGGYPLFSIPLFFPSVKALSMPKETVKPSEPNE
jgi:hypothetical protein